MITSIIKMKLLIHSQTPTAQPLEFGLYKFFHSSLYLSCDYLSLLGLKFDFWLKFEL